MNLTEQFDRLDKLIVDRSTDIATMRNILHSMREQFEAYQQDAETKISLQKKIEELQIKVATLEAENTKSKQPAPATIIRPGRMSIGKQIERAGL